VAAGSRKAPAEPRAFPSGAAFRAWLVRHHRKRSELLVLIFKTHAKHRGMTYFDALDEALCFGWIDGVRRRIDDDSFSIRFTPRRSGSIWSGINIERATALETGGRLAAAGLEAFRAREAKRSRIYAYESKPKALSPEYTRRLRSNRAAWEFFRAQAPWYQRLCAFRIMSAKREETRERRLAKLIDCSGRGVAIDPLLHQKLRASPRRPR